MTAQSGSIGDFATSGAATRATLDITGPAEAGFRDDRNSDWRGGRSRERAHQQIHGGQITTIAGSLDIGSSDAFVADSSDASANSALTGLCRGDRRS